MGEWGGGQSRVWLVFVEAGERGIKGAFDAYIGDERRKRRPRKNCKNLPAGREDEVGNNKLLGTVFVKGRSVGGEQFARLKEKKKVFLVFKRKTHQGKKWGGGPPVTAVLRKFGGVRGS